MSPIPNKHHYKLFAKHMAALLPSNTVHRTQYVILLSRNSIQFKRIKICSCN